ncbi:MAG TPA: helix-turn-helix transcriptional regulator [Candidatus Pelethomonas intestinigallinarum]|nr:helix-turn-helix transcriptional regulator [Candidatus Pelethomonas intestinigallinarum]
MDYMPFFSQRIYELRKQRGLSQKELGEAVGLSHKAISTIESGSRSTTIEKLVLLADFFGVSTDYLLGRREEP